MKIKISAMFEGTCDLCKREGKVFKVGNEDSKETLTICEDCVRKYKDRKVNEMIKEFGKKDEKSFERGLKFIE